MNKVTKKIIKISVQGILIIIMIFLAFCSKILVRSCNGAVGNMINKAEEPEPIERINEFANHMNGLCPVYFESWAKIESCVINQRSMNIKIVIDDDFINSYYKGSIILGIHQQFANEISDLDLMQKDMDSLEMSIKVLISQNNGDVIETIPLRPQDFFNSTLIKYEEQREYERNMNNIKGALENNPYKF